MTFANDKNENEIMSFILATPKAMKRYMLENTVVYVQEITDGKVGRAYKVGGEVLGQSIPYMSKKETTSRWMMCGVIKSEVKTDLKSKITNLTLDTTARTDKNNRDLDTNILYTKEINGLNPSLETPTIKYFSDDQGKNIISNNKQKTGDLYVIIRTNINDPNYKGSTNPIKINLK